MNEIDCDQTDYQRDANKRNHENIFRNGLELMFQLITLRPDGQERKNRRNRQQGGDNGGKLINNRELEFVGNMQRSDYKQTKTQQVGGSTQDVLGSFIGHGGL
jgi:hypothetical protein